MKNNVDVFGILERRKERSMDFSITEEQELLLESLDELMERTCPESYLRECEEKGEWPSQFTDALAENGFGLLGVPEEYGGTPVDTETLMLVSERITRNGAPIYIYGQALSLADMLSFGNEEQIAQCMDEVIAGRVGFVLGFTEPQAGSDSSALETTFKRKDGKVYLNGHKSFMSNAAHAKYMLCLARNADDDPNEAGKKTAFTMWWMPMDSPGVTIEPLAKIGWHMTNTCEVYLDNVELDEKDLVGVEGSGFMQSMANFEVERLLICAQSLGAAECAFEDAVRYATQRVQFGKPIGDKQIIQEYIADMQVKIDTMRNYVYKTAWEIDNNIPVQISSALCKLYCARSSCEVIDTAMQIMGGIGYTKDCRISRLWVDQRVQRIGGGTDEIMIHIAGRAIQKKYKS
jgi:alkylation response protein AidB-like acyl-CoA dehydrogenase